jgi:uncharacterized protein YrrD
MIVELSDLKKVPVRTVTGDTLGHIDMPVFNGKEATLLGFQVAKRGVMKKFAAVYFMDLIDLTRHEALVENEQSLLTNLRDFDEAFKNFGPVTGVVADTESGKRLGRIADVYIDITTGAIVRFYIKNLLQERIIPRDYLVAITPQKVVFKDGADQPVSFEKVAQPAEN